MRLPIKHLNKEEIISSLIAIVLPLSIIMLSTLYIISEQGEKTDQKSIEDRVRLLANYASIFVEKTISQKELSTLIKEFKDSLGIKNIAIISEDVQGELAFLKKKTYIIFPGSEYEGSTLSSTRQKDKLIFDMISRIDMKSGISITDNEEEIHIVKRVIKGTSPLYIYISESQCSNSSLPIQFKNAIIAILISIFILRLGF